MATRGGSVSPVPRGVNHLLERYSGTGGVDVPEQTGTQRSHGQSSHGSSMSPQHDINSSTHSNRQLVQAPPTSVPSTRPLHMSRQRLLSGGGGVLASSWAAIPTAINGASSDPVNDTSNCPTAAEIINLLREKVTILSGGRDRQGQSIITFPAKPKTYEYQRDAIRRAIQYLACIPTDDVREFGFSVIVDGRSTGWQSIKTILRTLQEALPAQINVVYTIQPEQFWQKKQTSRGHNKEKGKLEFSTVKLSSVDKLVRYVENSQLTSDLGGFLPYNHEHWLKLRLDLEHFISSFNSLMEHTAHVEQQLTADEEPSSVEVGEECMTRLVELQDQLRKAPQSTIREGNDLLRALEQGRDEIGTSSMTPDKINAQSVIRKLLEKIGQRQMQLDDLWRERKVVLEQALQLKVFERTTLKLRFWLKSRGEEHISSKCDIGSEVEEAQSLLEQQEKFEAKARYQHNTLTQLRRMADRFSGDQLETADSLQRQVSKLTARFSKFESNLDERRKIIKLSVSLHTIMKQWRILYEATVDLLKQDVQTNSSSMDDFLTNNTEQLAQLWQVADSVLTEATSLLELMKGATRKLPLESGKRAAQGYAIGIDYISHIMEDVENHRTRLGQLAEARELQAEELKRLHSCETDAKQVTQWLGDMLNQQILSSHGDVGASVFAVKQLISDHDKFTDSANKTYKYGCDLVLAAQRTRKSCRLDPHPSSTLLTTLETTWGLLSNVMDEVKGRLEMALEFHSLSEESLSCYFEWTRPIQQLPKSPLLIENKIIDMVQNRDKLMSNMERAIDIGKTLVDRLPQPLTSDPRYQTKTELVKRSLSFLRMKLDDLQRSCSELDSVLPHQVKLLGDFLAYCQFEQSIEKVLLWLQEHGLKQIQTFTRIGESQSAVRIQMDLFTVFLSQCQAHTPHVNRLHEEAVVVDSHIAGFKSDLVKKTTSLKAVWDKFLKRVEDRHIMLVAACAFYDKMEQFNSLSKELEQSLSYRDILKQDSNSYVNSFQSKLIQLNTTYQECVSQGNDLLTKLNLPPLNQVNQSHPLSSQMEELSLKRIHIDKLYSETLQEIKYPTRKSKANVRVQSIPPVETTPPIEVKSKSVHGEGNDKGSVKTTPPGYTPQGGGTNPVSNGATGQEPLQSEMKACKVKSKVIPREKVISATRVSKKLTNEYVELEEEAYKYLEEIETKCDKFLSNHTHFRDSPNGANVMCAEYEEFMLTFDPMTSQLETVMCDLLDLAPRVPPLESSIKQLCVSLRDRVAKRRATLTQRMSVLKLFDEFCDLYREVDSDLRTLDEFLSQPSDGSVTMETLGIHKVVMNRLEESYPKLHTQGNHFLEITSEILTARGAKLEVGGACMSVAFDLGDVEGRYPDIAERWKVTERELTQQTDWQAFKSNYDQISTWLMESAGLFLATRVDVGTSLETVEDLLMELGEFEIRANRTASEVESLLVQSEAMLSSGVRESSELSNLAWDLRTLHEDFEKELQTRRNSLKSTIDFFMNAEQLNSDMRDAVECCHNVMIGDLPTNFKITSVSTRLTNLQHDGFKILECLGLQPPTPEHTHKKGKSRVRRTESSSASELAIKQTLAKLQKLFGDYKKAVERRTISPSPQRVISPPTEKPPSSGEVAITRRKSDLKSPPPKYVQDKGTSSNTTDKPVSPVGDTSNEEVKKRRKTSVVQQRVVALNQQSAKEDAIPLTDLGIAFGYRSRSHTTSSAKSSPCHVPDKANSSLESQPDPLVDRQSGDKLSKETAELSMSDPNLSKIDVSQNPPSESKSSGDSPGGVILRRRTQTMSATLPSRGGGVSRSERKEKINAIRQLFESSSLKAALCGMTELEKSSADKEANAKKESLPLTTPTPSSAVTSQPKGTSNVDDMPPNDDTTPIGDTKDEGIGRSHSPIVILSPPMTTPTQTQAAPTVYKTVLKDNRSSKQHVITINMDLPVSDVSITPSPPPTLVKDIEQDPPSVDQPAAQTQLRTARVTRSASPQSQKLVTSQDSSPRRASRRPPPLLVSGQVSSLRSMFDNQAAQTASTMPRLRSSSYSAKPRVDLRSRSPAHHRYSGNIEQLTLREVSVELDLPDKPTEEDSSMKAVVVTVPDLHSPDHCMQVVDHSEVVNHHVQVGKLSALLKTENISNAASETSLAPVDVPRPASPVGQLLVEESDSGSATSEFEFNLSSDEFETSSDDIDAGWEEPDSFNKRIMKSMSVLLSDLVQTEEAHMRSVKVLATVYVPLMDERHVPTYLQGRQGKIFANILEIHKFERQFGRDVCTHGESIEGVCNVFVRSGSGLKCYIPFLSNMKCGLGILTGFGGSFFEDKQRAIADEESITSHYCRVKERLVEYDHFLRDLVMCSQKEALNAVNIVKDALQTVQRVLREADNTIALDGLRDCPYALTVDHMIRRDVFQMYSTRGAKKVKEYHVFLSDEYVTFTRAKRESKDGRVHYEVTESLKVTEMHLLETYKSRMDTFALCEGKLSPDNLRVLTPVTSPLLMKTVWLQEIRPLLQKTHSRRTTVGGEDMPLPYCFQGSEMPRPQPVIAEALAEREGWFGSLRRNKSIRRSLRKSKRKRGKEAETNGQGLEKDQEDKLSRHSQISGGSAEIPPPALADIQLASITHRGQFLQVQNSDIYVVVKPFSSEREGFLAVEPGQMVEVLDNSKNVWMVLTMPQEPGELEMEGFILSSCLRQATEAESRRSTLSRDSHKTALKRGVALYDLTTPNGKESPSIKQIPNLPVQDPNHTPSDQLNESESVVSIPNMYERKAESVPTTPDSAMSGRKFKPPNLDLTLATPTHPLSDEVVKRRHDEDRPSIGCRQFERIVSYHEAGPNASYLSPMSIGRKLGDYSCPTGPELTSSLRSLPATFSPVVTPRSNKQKYLGYDPMQIVEVTLSYPELGPPAPPTVKRQIARDEMKRLRLATVQNRDDITPSSVDDFDPVEVYYAIADFEAAEECNISLTAGQCVEVLDGSRGDWWLVVSTDSGREGWVPACYLEKQTLSDPMSPPPEPFEDENGELQRIMMKGRSPSEIVLNRRQLYKALFLSQSDRKSPEEPSDAQLQGMFSIEHPYVAATEVQAECSGQLSLIQEQPVTVVDSKRDDWWLVRTVSDDDDLDPPVEGWVHASKLRPDDSIREDVITTTSTSVATITSTYEGPAGSDMPCPQETSPQSHSRVPFIRSPSSTPLWRVLADYEATETGMMSVRCGELVEVMDISRNEWCLVRPNSSQDMEGWVPMVFLKPYNVQGYANSSLIPPWFHQQSSSSDESSVESPKSPEHSSVTVSPEALQEAADELSRTEAKKQRRFAISELITTERDYVEKLKYCLEHYYPSPDESNVQRSSPIRRSVRECLFGNLSDIYTFHRDHFLPELTACENDPTKLGDSFVKHEEQLHMYITYCKNKEKSEVLYRGELGAYFDEQRTLLRDRLKLPDYLILPVQRITKYTLFLQDFHKHSVRAGLEEGSILSALEVSRDISTLANNAIHLNLLDERVNLVDLGKLLMQEVFGSLESHKQLYKERRVFLFEKALIITKKRHDHADKERYIVKEQLMLRDISMTQDMDPNRLNIITYDMLTGTKFILRAPKTSVRDAWLAKANALIRQAKQNAANNLTSRSRSSSEASEQLTRTYSFSRKSMLKREGSKRRSLKRPHSSNGRASSSPEEQPPAGTEYVVMECIVMEGGDDVTLEPGEIVQLMKVEPGGGMLCVKTMDTPPVEGKILSSYLRRRNSVKGLKMEAIPKFTMTPSDMDPLVGSTATISCAFNGYPVPNIVWLRDHVVLTGEEGGRVRITSCPTSSVLEIIKLEYEDIGTYSCSITNSMGTDSADMILNIHGPPGKPLKVTASKITSTSVKLKWSPPENDGDSSIHCYQVEMLQEGFDTWQPIVQQPRNQFMVKSLLPNTTYLFRVIAHNEYGPGEPSESTKVIMGTKGRGWLSQSFRRGNSAQSNMESTNDSVDGVFDELGLEDMTSSPQRRNIRRGSVSIMFDVMPEELGRGRYGIVHCCVHKQSGAELAAKYVRLRSKRKASIRREVNILQKIRGKSPNLIEFSEAFERGRNLIIITELVPDGELIERIIADNDLTEGVAVGYLSQLLSAVNCIHQLSIAHLDIRPENIMLAGNTLKLIDFGSACDMNSDLSPVYTSSVEFCAPEILNQELPSLSSDLWSVGVLAYVILSGISPFFADNIQAIVERIKESRYNFYHDQFNEISQEAKDFIAALLQKSHEYRLSASAALQHPWIKTLERLGVMRESSSSPWPMAKLDISGLKTFNARRKWHTMSVAIDDTTVFGPKSTICLSPTPLDFEEMEKDESPPHLWDGPTELQVRVGSKVNIQYHVAGNPEPTVEWEHEDTELHSTRHHVIKTMGGVTNVCVTDVNREDEGVYMCVAVNSHGSVSQECQLTVLDVPSSPTDVSALILGTYNSAMVSWLPPIDTGNTPVTNYILQKRQLEIDCWEDVMTISGSTAHVVEDLVPRVSYLFRVAAGNEVGISSPSKPSDAIAIAKDYEYDSDSPCPDEVRLKMSSFEIEYERGEDIWKGNFTKVIQCRERTTDRLYAAKILSTENPSTHREKAMVEFEMHSILSHPRLVQLEDAFQSDKNITLVLEYLPGGTLQELLARSCLLDEQTSSKYLRKVTEGLQYLHETMLILVNLSPNNILLTGNHNDVKLCDFGMLQFIESGSQLSELEGQVEYMSPEAVAMQPLTTAADIWSMGTIAYLMLTGVSPFYGSDQDSTVTNISTLQLDTLSPHYVSLSSDAQDFIQYRTIVRNPQRRLTAVQCQRHRWLQAMFSRQTSSDHPIEQIPVDGGKGSSNKPHTPTTREDI